MTMKAIMFIMMSWELPMVHSKSTLAASHRKVPKKFMRAIETWGSFLVVF